MIYLNTLQHTGTWFLISFLLDHPEVEGFSQVSTLPMHLAGLDVPEHKLLGGKRIREWVPASSRYVLHQHPILQPGRLALVPEQERLCRELLKVVPMRDPLAALISHYKREPVPEFRLPRIVDRWVAFCRVVRDMDITYLPVDWLELDERTEALRAVLEALGLNPSHADSYEWSRVNSQGYFNLDDLYDNGDAEALSLMPEWHQLRAYEDDLRPWLASMGYRDLLWWT